MEGRALCLLCAIGMAVASFGQDFAHKFMEQCAAGKETYVQCHTVSPKMMEKVMDMQAEPGGDEEGEVPEYILSKLKSARIITAEHDGEVLFREAEALISKNKNRFTPWGDPQAETKNKIFVRWHDETVRELVMLDLDEDAHTLTIVNLTGEMDGKFMRLLSSGSFGQEP